MTLDQFRDALSKYGILAESQLASLPTAPTDVESLARELVQQGTLTRFQAINIYQGRGKGLVYGEYIVLDKLGEGGMGQVYKAKHRRMKRIVALKVLPPGAVNSAKAVQRFHQEVEVAARLSHPNIVIAHDAGEAHGRHYLVMEYVEGCDLSSYVKKNGPLGVEQATNVVLQAARGLAYAHSLGIIHRDVKPSNLLIDRKGRVKILDMGLARFDNPLADGGPPSSELTGSGEVMGTVDYMAPEQAQDTRQADHRADIYALGCTLYRLLSGKPPYQGDTMIQKILAHREQPVPSLQSIRSDVPEVLDRLYQKMMAKDPAERISSLDNVVTTLEMLLSGVLDELSAVVAKEEVVQTDGFDLSLLPPSSGPSDVLADMMNPAGSSIGRSKPGSTSGGIQGVPTQAFAYGMPPMARPVMAMQAQPTQTPTSGRKASPAVVFLGGVAAMLLVGVVIWLATRSKEPAQEVAVVPPSRPTDSGSKEPLAPQQTTEPEPKSPPATPRTPSPPKETTTTDPSPPDKEPPTPPFPIDNTPPPPKKTTSTTTTTPPTISPSPPVKERTRPAVRVNLLRLVDLKRDTVGGIWSSEPTALVTPMYGPGEGRPRRNEARLQFPYTPPLEYELHVDLELAQRLSRTSLGLLVGPSRASFVIEKYPSRNAGLELIDEKKFQQNETAVTGAGFDVGEVVSIVCRVRPTNIIVLLNGRQIIDWKGEPQQLSLKRSETPPDPTKLFVNCSVGGRFTKYEVLPLGGEPQAIPDTDALTAARARSSQFFVELPRDATATRKSDQAALMHYQASLADDDDALCYALLIEAARLATAAEDVDLTQYLLEELGRCFRVDTLAIFEQSLREISGVAAQRPLADRARLFTKFMDLADQQLTAERYDTANLLIKSAAMLISKTKEVDLQKELGIRELEAGEWQKLWAAAKTAEKALDANQADAKAHLAVGQYLACARNDWQAALGHLVRSSDAAIGGAAQMEIQSANDMARSAEIGTAWLGVAEKATIPLKVVYLEHARIWFTRGIAGLSKPALAKLTTRFKKVETDNRKAVGLAFLKRHPLRSVAFGGHWYKFIDEPLSWHEARQRCQEMGGELVVLDTPEKCQFIYQLAATQFGGPDVFEFWIGATEEGHDEVFTWASGAPLQFADWASKEPTAGSLGEAVAAKRQGAGSPLFKWIDTATNTGYPFVCEWER